MIKRFVSYFKPYKALFWLDLAAAFLVAGIDLVYPLLTKSMLNDYIQNKAVKTVIIIAASLIVLYFIKMGLNYFMGYQGHVMSAKMQRDMRKDLFAHLEELPVSFFDKSKTGVLISRATGDLQDVSELAHHGPEDLFTSIVLLVGSSIIMAMMNWFLTLILVLCLPPMVWFMAKKRTHMKRSMKASRVRMGEMSAALENSFTGIRVSKAYDAKNGEKESFEKVNDNYLEARCDVSRAMGGFMSVMTFSSDFLYWIVLVVGGLFAIYSTEMSGGIIHLDYVELVTFMLYVNVFLQPLKKLVGFIEQYQNGMSGFSHFCELMDVEPEKDNENAVDIERAEGKIEFKNVSFSYNEDKEVLANVNLTVEKGKTLALVGPTGGGKTTICHLIPRFYTPDDGEILLDGKNVQDITLSSLRKNVGIVAQDLFLFDATIFENIAYGRAGATIEEVKNAAKLANLEEFILSLPNGYDTEVGERGVRLSGGQKQRIAIARAFLKNPPVLILDEATSALDTVTERMIQESLEKLSEGRTVIVVAHRLSTIRRADEIIVINGQGIAERGSHEELLLKNGIYASLYNATVDEYTI